MSKDYNVSRRKLSAMMRRVDRLAAERLKHPVLRSERVLDRDTQFWYWLHWRKKPFTLTNAEFGGIDATYGRLVDKSAGLVLESDL